MTLSDRYQTHPALRHDAFFFVLFVSDISLATALLPFVSMTIIKGELPALEFVVIVVFLVTVIVDRMS
jgi:hypothetical protein